jgi:hypothetical protein
MQASLASEAFRSALEAAVNAARFGRVVAVSDREIASWTTEEFRWDQLPRVAGGTTDIQSALKRYQSRLHDVLLFTDDDGAEQVVQAGWAMLRIAKAPDFDIVVPGSAGT